MIKEYYKPATVKEAVELKKSNGGNASYLGGGTKINHGSMSESVEKVISLENISLGGIEVNGDTVKMGSQVTLQEILESEVLPVILKDSAKYTYSRNLRNMATVGGSIAAGKADCYIIPALVALSASVETEEDGVMSVEEYVTKGASSLIKSVSLTKVSGNCSSKKVSRSCNSLPVLTVAVRVASDEAVVAVSGVADKVVRLSSVEEGIVNGTLKSAEEIEKAVSSSVSPKADLVGSVEYKTYIAGVTVADCIELCK